MFKTYQEAKTPEQVLESKLDGSRMRHMKEFFGERFEKDGDEFVDRGITKGRMIGVGSAWALPGHATDEKADF